MAASKWTGRKSCLFGAVTATGISILLILGSLILPTLFSRNYAQRSLASMQKEMAVTKFKFASILSAIDEKKDALQETELPEELEDYFVLFQTLRLDPDSEGIALATADGYLEVWYGKVIELGDLIPPQKMSDLKREDASFIVENKSSAYLVSLQPLSDGMEMIIHFKHLAFMPQFQSIYVLESHALETAFQSDFIVDYWNHEEDVARLENLLSRYPEGFIGEPFSEEGIQTLIFPLRNENGRIIATVNLFSPSLASRMASLRQALQLGIWLFFVIAGLLLIIYLWTSPDFLKKGKIIPGGIIFLLAFGLRAAFIPIGKNDGVQSLSVFSPATAGFLSLGGLTRSPADIFLTALFLFTLTLCLAITGRKYLRNLKKAPVISFLVSLIAAGLAAGGFVCLQWIVAKAVFNSNFSLLRWSFDGSFLLLHLGLLLFTGVVITVLFMLFRVTALLAGSALLSGGIAVGFAGGIMLFLTRPPSLLLYASSLVILCGIAITAAKPELLIRREILFLGLLLVSFFLARAIDGQNAERTKTLLETSIRHTILSQETWGNFLLEESFLQIDTPRRQEQLIAYLKNPIDPDFAHSYWKDSLIAKFNWYSSLEIRDGEGNILSRFALNVPKASLSTPELPPARNWSVVRHSLEFIGKEKDFLIGYKDWYEESYNLGRLAIYVSLDPETLPFLYSANPYFEVLRTNSLPSLSQFEFGWVIFNLDGIPLSNPEKLSTPILPADRERLIAMDRPFWTTFEEKGMVYDAFLFRSGNQLFKLYTAQKEFKTQAVEFLRIFFFALVVIVISLLLFTIFAGKALLREPFRSFSNRVYAAFLAAVLVPLLIYTVFTRNLFDRIFAERFVEDAAIHASFARSLVEDFLILGTQEVSPSLAPTEDLVSWISTTLENDITLYIDAKLVASSRREFFDTGLLPEILDGETYHNLVFKKNPYDTQRTAIGGYSFQTLTVPYPFRGSTLFIFLPFPFEKEEIGRATREIVEFLVLFSSFFFLLVYILSRGVRTMIILPIRKLLAGTREVSLGNLEVTIDHTSRDEMMTLIDGFNTMIRELKTREQDLAEMSKKVAWTEMARKVAHEIKNPLTPIQLSAEHILKVYEDKKGDFDIALRESISYIINEVENLRTIAQEFMEIARDTTLHKSRLDIRAILEETIEPYRKLLSERIHFRIVYEGESFPAEGDGAKLKTAIRNIVANAVEAIIQKGEIRITLRKESDRVVLSIQDSGPGIGKEALVRIFDPYFSTKDSGTGLGLPIAKKIIDDHGGTIRVSSAPQKGTTVIMDFPAQN